MRALILFCSLGLIACAPHGEASSPQNQGDIKRDLACVPSGDAMSCVRQRCAGPDLQFDEIQGVCRCPAGTILSTVGPYHCVQAETKKGFESGWFQDVNEARGQQFDFILATETSDELTNLSLPEAALIPLSGRRGSSLSIHSSAAELRTSIPFTLMGDPGVSYNNYLRSPELELPNDLNGGIADAVKGMPFSREVLRPSNEIASCGNRELDEVLAQAVKGLNVNQQAEKFLSYTESGCASQCEGRKVLSENDHYLVYRFRAYYAGVPVQDQISVFDKVKRETSVTAYLLNGQVHMLARQEGNDTVLYANQADDARIGVLQTRPELSAVAPYALSGDEAPVTLFEAATNPDLIPTIVRGPFADQHVFGWFRKEDNLPFFKNYMAVATRFGEDDLELDMEAEHGKQVAALATGNYKHPAIPFSGHDLLDGTFQKFLTTYRAARPVHTLVAALSSSFILSAGACAASPLGKVVRESTDRMVWAISAGNSGAELNSTDSACPQVIKSPNVLRVASSADGISLARTSSFSTRTVEVAEIGCLSGNDTCSNAESATSFAAPRVARKLSDLATQFPQATPSQIAFAVLVTARIPYSWSYYHYDYVISPLPVISGGFVDQAAAAKLLSQLAQWPANSDLRNKKWVSLLLSAKRQQFPDVRNGYVSSLINQEIALLLKRKVTNAK